LEAAGVTERDYAEALSRVLKELVCSGNDNAIHVLRGAGFLLNLEAAGATGIDLINDLTSKESKNCPVSAAMEEADRTKFLEIKQDVEMSRK
jgi:hypothetical protein